MLRVDPNLGTLSVPFYEVCDPLFCLTFPQGCDKIFMT